MRCLRVFFAALAVYVALFWYTDALAANLVISTNQSSLNAGGTLSLSASMTPTNNAGLPVDIYVALILPNGDLLLLDGSLNWVDAVVPVVAGVPVSNLVAPNFYSTPMPGYLPSGIYEFHIIAVLAGTPAHIAGNWVGTSATSLNFISDEAVGVQLTTINATCTVNQACNVPLVSAVTGGSTPYHFQQDSFAYGTRPLNTNIDVFNGNLVGTPSQEGAYSFQICAVDVGGNQDCQMVTVTVAPVATSGNLRVHFGGDVAPFTLITLNGDSIKPVGPQNLDLIVNLAAGSHSLSVTCTQVYCFAFLQIQAPSGYTISPSSISLSGTVLLPGDTRNYTLVLSP